MQEQWDQAQQILQGGIDRSLAGEAPLDQAAQKLGLASMEIHMLRRHWPQAVDTASQFLPHLPSSNASSPDHSEAGGAILRFAAAATVAQVCFPGCFRSCVAGVRFHTAAE